MQGVAPPPAAPFPDVAALLETSEPVRQTPRLWFAMGAFLLLMLLIGTLSSQLTNGMKVVAAVTTGVLMISLSVMTSLLIRRVRGEQQTLTAITELVQLRRWPDAAMKLTGYLDGETQSHSMRAQALILLASVLARYHRFADAILVHDYLLEQGGLDPSSEFALRVGRAMAMLREDHLFDADRAISEMRRAAATGQGVDTAGLALVELYRDVKTGHPHEAIETFEKHGTVIRDQLGHRMPTRGCWSPGLTIWSAGRPTPRRHMRTRRFLRRRRSCFGVSRR